MSHFRFIAWKLRNQYDKEGQLVEPRPRGEDVDEERFLAWVSLRVQRDRCRGH